MFNVCFGDREAGMLKYYLSWYRDGKGVEKFLTPYAEHINKEAWNVILEDVSSAEVVHLGLLCLDDGNIDRERFEQCRKEWIHSFFYGWFGPKKINKLYTDEMRKVDQIIERAKTGETVKIWHSNAPFSACGYYYLVDRLQGLDCNIVSVGIKDTYIGQRGEERPLSLGGVDIYDIAVAVEYARKLDVTERNEISVKWQKLQQENAEIRVYEGGKIISTTPDFFDKYIMQFIPLEGEFAEARLVGNVLGKCGHCVKDSYISDRIELMIEQGVFEVVKEAKKNDPPYYKIIKFVGKNNDTSI